MDNVSRNIRFNVPKKNELSSKKNHLISVFKSFEVTINDKKKKYFDKIQSLLGAWDQLAVYVSTALSESPLREFELLFYQTLKLVLRADWPRSGTATQTHLTVTLQRFSTGLSNSKRFPSILQQCRVLESIVKNPWSHPLLSRIFTEEEIDIDSLLEYFQYENGQVIVVRLEMMLGAQCEDMALRLSKQCLLTYYNSHPLELDFNQNEIDYITDIYFCTLYRDKKKKELTNEIKVLELDEGLQLLKRYNKNGGVGKGFNDNCKDVRVWKYSSKVMELAANTLLANAVLHDELVDSDSILPDLIAEWAAIQKAEDDVNFSPTALEIIRKLVISAVSSKCIYPFCSFLIENCARKELYQSFVAQCLIHAINQNMNEIESYRVHHDYENLKSTYEQLSQGFVLISRLFDDYKNIYRECLLTSFSLTPSREGLEELETFIVKSICGDENVPGSPKNVIDGDGNVSSISTDVPKNDLLVSASSSKNATKDDHTSTSQLCEPVTVLGDAEHLEVGEGIVDLGEEKIVDSQSNPEAESVAKEVTHGENVGPVTEGNEELDRPGILSEEKDLLSLATGTKLKSGEEIEREAAPAYCGEVENLKLDDSMKTDLSSILRYQRFRSLSWELDWSELKINCENFLEMFEKRGFHEVDLKYLDIDYSQFKDKPINEDDYIGYEKGYEHFAEPEPEWEEYDHEHMNGDWPHSSEDTDEEYALKRRKKIIRRNKLKKAKAKTKVTYAGSSEEFVYSSDDAIVTMKKRKVSTDSADGEWKVRKKRLKKPKPSNETDVAIDSQSENYPPDDMNLMNSNEAVDELQNTTDLQLLKQSRIGSKTPNGGELSEIVNNDAKAKLKLTPVKIVIPKCDNGLDSDVVVEKRIRPRISVTLPVPGKRSTMQLSTKRNRRTSDSDSLYDFTARCVVRLPKSDSIEEMLSRETDTVVSTQLDKELQSLMELFEPGQVKEQDSALAPIVESATEENAPTNSNLTEDERNNVNNLTEDKPITVCNVAENDPVTVGDLAVDEPITVVAPEKNEMILDPKPKTIVIKRRTKKEKVSSEQQEVKRQRGRPRKNPNPAPVDPSTISEHTPNSSASLSNTLMSSNAPPPGTSQNSSATMQTEGTINSYLGTSYLQPSLYTPISCNNRVSSVPSSNYPDIDFLNVNHFLADNSDCWDPNSAPFSYLNALMCQNANAESSGNVVPTCAPTSTVQSPQTMCSAYTNPYVGSSESTMISPSVDASLNRTSSMSVSSYTQTETSFAVDTQTTYPMSTNSNVTPSPNVAQAFSYSPSAVHTNLIATSSSPVVVPSPNHTQSPPMSSDMRYPMLHHALQETSNQDSIAPVQQITGKYNEIIFKFPEMQQTVVSGKKTTPKRPRQPKKNITSPDNQMADGQPAVMKKPRISEKDIVVSDHQPSIEANQQSIDRQPVKINRKRQPKKEKISPNQPLPSESLPETNEQPSSTSFVPDQNHELSSTPLAAAQLPLDEKKNKVKKPRPRKPKVDIAVSNGQLVEPPKKKQGRPRKSQVENTKVPSFFMPSQMNVQPASGPALPNTLHQQSLDVSMADSNLQQSLFRFHNELNYQTSAISEAHYPQTSGEIEIKQPQDPNDGRMFDQIYEISEERQPNQFGQPKIERRSPTSVAMSNFRPTFTPPNPNAGYHHNGFFMPQVNSNIQLPPISSVANSYLQTSFVTPTLCSGYQPNVSPTGVDYQTAVEKVRIKRTPKRKKDVTLSEDQPSASSDERQQPKKLGRPRKPKQETVQFNHQSAVFAVSEGNLEPSSSTSNANVSYQELSSYSMADSNLLPSLDSSILDSNHRSSVLTSVDGPPQKPKERKPRAKLGRPRKSDNDGMLLQYETSALPNTSVNHGPFPCFLGPNSNQQSSIYYTNEAKPQPYQLPAADTNYQQPLMYMLGLNQSFDSTPTKIRRPRKPKVTALPSNQPPALAADGEPTEVVQPIKRRKNALDGQPPKPRRPSKAKKGALPTTNQSTECFTQADHRQTTSLSMLGGSSQPDFIPEKVEQSREQKIDQAQEPSITAGDNTPPVPGHMMGYQAPPISVVKADKQEPLPSAFEIDCQPTAPSFIMKLHRKPKQNITLSEHASGFSVSGANPVLPATLENVSEPARQNEATSCSSSLNPRVLLHPLPNLNAVKLPTKPQIKNEKGNADPKTVYNGCPRVEVRVTPISLSHFQQNEPKETTVASFGTTTCNQYSSATQFPSQKSESRSLSSNEYEAGLSVRLTSSDQPTRASNVAVSQVNEQRAPNFSMPKTSRAEMYNDTSAPFINASTPKTLAEELVLIAVADLSSVPSTQQSTPLQTPPSYQRQFVNQLQPQYSQLYEYDQHRSSTMVYDGNSSSQQFLCDDNPFGSSQNRSNRSMQMNVEQGPSPNNYYSNNYSVMDCSTSSTTSGDNSLTQNIMVSNLPTAGLESVKVQYTNDGDTDGSEGVCISIPENAISIADYDESMLGNYLPLIKNTSCTSNSFPPSEQNISSVNDLDDLFRQFFPSE